MLMPALLMGVIGGAAAVALAVAARAFYVETDPRISQVEDALPGANCGGCGYAGCGACAEAIVAGEAETTACVAGGPDVWAACAAAMGTEVAFVEPRAAQHRCSGGFRALRKFEYDGAMDCRVAVAEFGGPLACRHGCVGMGSCVNACQFGALTMGPEGLPVLDPTRCVGCGACERICPTGAISIHGLSDRLLHFIREDECIEPCAQLCPAQVNIRSYIDLAREGRYAEAIRRIRERNPLPVTCGRICPAPCEMGCRRGEVDDDGPVHHNAVKRFLADWDMARDDRPIPKCLPDTGKRIAVVGGGPAGLSASWFLRRLGHAVTIFEALPKLGGMLRYGIPEYRLPKARLDWEIGDILKLGVEARTDTRLGTDVSFADLERDFDVIFLASGAWDNHTLRLAHEDEIEGVWRGTEFLAKRELGEPVDLEDKNVIVVGGGNTAIDAARSSLRLGARKVTLMYRRTRTEMPANEVEIVAAEHEGIDFLFLAAPAGLVDEKGKLTHVRYLKMELGEPDASGRRRPVPIEGSETDEPADVVVAAIGQKPRLEWVDESLTERGLKLTRWNTIEADDETLQSGLPHVFTAGDVFSGPALVVDAIGTGRRAARSIHHFLTDQPLRFPEGTLYKPRKLPQSHAFLARNVAHRDRIEQPELPVDERVHNWDEVDLTVPQELMEQEAQRCLLCGTLCYDDDDARQEREHRRRPGIYERVVKVLEESPS